MPDTHPTTRRRFLALALATALGTPHLAAAAPRIHTRAIPVSDERLPAIGMGTWITFDVARGQTIIPNDALTTRWQVLQTFFAAGGRLIDSSPMYGSAEAVLGELLPQSPGAAALFSATKVWTPGQWMGEQQMARSRDLWGVPRFDLMQIHNLLDWDAHLPTLRRMKADGQIRYLGITTSHGRRHDDLAALIRNEALDFVQLTYNLAHRAADRRLLPLAAERGCAVIINRPFDGGHLFNRVRGKPLPGYAAEIGCTNWAQVFLKFVISHPAITCAIPATSQPAPMRENMGALHGPLPEAALRRSMAEHFDRL
ncbi:aldo/keto reductase [Denitromonas ohlonensis]|uniref:Aldo/keto reductase n=2 Tax=Denitromonas TaxID=139331 RepID=A0A557RPN4_9RHOO|nr:aldo/keto reductase [Denitromonas ohlonensis]TVO67116.1 aldo/keto reductase [Denitromonas ohlonensis]TVO79176.1 aldo/keto reductase [Denitromonas ohlonensis]